MIMAIESRETSIEAHGESSKYATNTKMMAIVAATVMRRMILRLMYCSRYKKGIPGEKCGSVNWT
jgi:hypothetical protein